MNLTPIVRACACATLLLWPKATRPTYAFVGAYVPAVRTLDENDLQLNVIDVSATPLTVEQMTADVAAAFDAGRGGVVDFDSGVFSGPRTIDILFADATKLLRITNTQNDWRIGVLGPSPASGAISGGNVIFLGGPNTLNELVFGPVTDAATGAVLPERVKAFGFTIIDSNFNGVPNDVNMSALYSNLASTPLNHQIPRASNTADTFFGFTAPAGAFLAELSFFASNNTAGDDFAFITAPVPEPAGAALAAMALAVGAPLRRAACRRFHRAATHRRR